MCISEHAPYIIASPPGSQAGGPELTVIGFLEMTNCKQFTLLCIDAASYPRMQSRLERSRGCLRIYELVATEFEEKLRRNLM